MKKRVCMLILAVLMVLSCASCKLMVKDEQKDLEQVVARVERRRDYQGGCHGGIPYLPVLLPADR